MMIKTINLIALSVVLQTTLHAENYQAKGSANSPETAQKIITPKAGSQYNLDGMKIRDGQYKSSYSTKSVDESDATNAPSPDPYGSNIPLLPIVPVIIIDE